jgi:predicted RNA-binding protein YlqC (UPF0109 family)
MTNPQNLTRLLRPFVLWFKHEAQNQFLFTKSRGGAMIATADRAVTATREVSRFNGRDRSNIVQDLDGVMDIRELILLNIRAIVDQPEQVSIEAMPGEESTMFRVQVAPDDLGKAIGKQGRLANALRALIKAAATKNGYRVYLEVV